jgi:hypothetical protein
MKTLAPALVEYCAETRHLDAQASSTENTFYPAIKSLISTVLREGRLPFRVRVNTSEGKGKSRDMPDFVLDDEKMFVGVFGEVKRADVSLDELAASTEQDDQIGRYLAQTGVVLLSNLRGLGLLACAPGYDRPSSGSVPPGNRALIKTVDLWSAVIGTGRAPKSTTRLSPTSSKSSKGPSRIMRHSPIPPVSQRCARDRRGMRRIGFPRT